MLSLMLRSVLIRSKATHLILLDWITSLQYHVQLYLTIHSRPPRRTKIYPGEKTKAHQH